MIPHIIRNKNQKSGVQGIRKLVRYTTEKNTQKLETPVSEYSATDAERLTKYMTRDAEKIKDLPTFFSGTHRLDADGISVMHNVPAYLDKIPDLMAKTAENAKCDKPMMHYVLSWQSDETPSEKEIFDSALFTLKVLGLQEHQYVCAIHNDTDNIHVHIAVNRVHPVTGRVNVCGYSFDTLHQACRVLELKHGFKHDTGAYIVNKDNQIVRHKAPKKEGEKPDATVKMEHYTGRQSMIDYLVTEPAYTDQKTGMPSKETVFDAIKADIDKTNYWFAVSDIFKRAGMTLECSKHANGLLICHEKDGVKTKVSWSRIFNQKGYDYKSLCERFGHEFYTRSHEYSVKPLSRIYGRGYSPDAMLRERYNREKSRTERLEQRMLLKGRYQEYKSALPRFESDKDDFKARISQISEETRAIKRRIKGDHRSPMIRRQFYNIAEFERWRKINALKHEKQAERNGFFAANPRLTYRQWVEREAANGDSAAVSQLRGWYYKQSRKRSNIRTLKDTLDPAIGNKQSNVLMCENRPDFPVNPRAEIYGVTPEVWRSGDILYRNKETGEPQFIDRGHSLVCASTCTKSAKSGAVALAVKDFQATRIDIHGDDDFKREQQSNFRDFVGIDKRVGNIKLTTNLPEMKAQEEERDRPKQVVQTISKTAAEWRQDEYDRQSELVRRYGQKQDSGSSFKP